jgi:DNA-directed RNA polymerase subunit RPC12/RpoP
MLWLLRCTQHQLARFMLQPKKHSPVALSATENQRCPRCHTKMKLARITPGSPGFEIRSLECPECEHAIARRVAVDPEPRPENRHGVGKSPWSA